MLAAASLLVLGLAIGSRIASSETAAPSVTVTVSTPAAPEDSLRPSAPHRATAGYPRTQRGAVAAASAYLAKLGGPALLDATRVRAIVQSIASQGAREHLTTAYEQAVAQARQALGTDSIPTPLVILRAAPVGFRVVRFTAGAATVAVWRVGIVGSGATVTPQQSWRTETVSLVWERGSWKVEALASRPGPTPPLNRAAASTPSDLFTSIPRYQGFSHVDP